MIPIFIIVHDRVEFLKKAVESYQEQIKTPIEIIFHDVASTYKPCLDYLEVMRGKGYLVYRSEINHHHTVLTSITDYLEKHPECNYYCVTDHDIELDNVNGDILDFYIHLLEMHGKNFVVGPMLRIDDIPDCYPKKEMVMHLHKKLGAWNAPILSTKWKGSDIKYVKYEIDTTFQLAHRSNLTKFRRKGYRCLAPFSCRHLDWYVDPKKTTPDYDYYSENATKISHWANPNWGNSKAVKTKVISRPREIRRTKPKLLVKKVIVPRHKKTIKL